MQLEELDLDVGLGDPLADLPVVEPAGLSGGELEELGEELAVDAELTRIDPPLVGEGGVGDPPAVAGLTDQCRVGYEHAVEDHFVELGVAGDLHERADLDAVRVHVDRQAREPELTLRCVGVAAGEAESDSRRTGRRRSTPCVR